MTELLLLVIVCQLAYLLHCVKKPEKEEKKSIDYQKIMPGYIGKTCELILKEPLYGIDVMYSVSGAVVDCDSAWVMIEMTVKKKPVRKMLRISNIRSIKEIA